MEKRFTASAPVLSADGRPNPGWASQGLLQYSRRAIRASRFRIKEWDWYQVSDETTALQFTYGHASYAGQIGVMLFNFAEGKHLFTKDKILVLPFSSLGLEESAEEDGVLEYNKRDLWMRLERCGPAYTLACRCEGLQAEVTLTRQTPHSLVINIPFDEKPTQFYYNQKISCMAALGRVDTKDGHHTFDHNAWGLLDWGRGVWPFHNEWYWSSASGRLGGEIFGFNLGCGFGNTSAATENCLFYKDAIHKLGRVHITTGPTYMDPWRLHDDAGRLDLTLTPSYDRETKIKLLWVNNNTHQMFGTFSGHATLCDGTTLQIQNLTGFAEHAVNNW